MTNKSEYKFFLDPAAEDFSFHEMDRIRREAGRLQAEMVAKHARLVAGGAWRFAKWTGRKAAGAYSTLMGAVAAQHAFEALNRLSDSDLERIGLTREEIPHRVTAILDSASGRTGTVMADLYAVAGGGAKSRKPRTEMPERRAA